MQIHLSMSEVALIVIRQELGLDLDIDNHDVDDLVGTGVVLQSSPLAAHHPAIREWGLKANSWLS